MAIAMAGMYLAVGLITARFLEKRRMRAATVLHTILFVLIAFLLLLIPEKGGIAELTRAMYGEETYEALREAFITPVRMLGVSLSAALIAEGICLAMFVVTMIALIKGIAEKIGEQPKAEQVGESPLASYEGVTRIEEVWLKLCRIRS